MKKQKVLILGNKPYTNFQMDEVVDSFDMIYRFNLAHPGKNNGTKFGKLVLCNHIYNYFVKNPVSREQIIQIYRDEYTIPYLNEWYDFFQANKEKFDEIYYQTEHSWYDWNSMLEEYGSPYSFSKMASTGYSTIFATLLENKEVYVAGFTLCQDELRETAGDAPGIAEARSSGNSCHSFSDEARILAWLHNNKKVDASLCMLEDTKEVNLRTNEYNTTPSKFILELLSKEKK